MSKRFMNFARAREILLVDADEDDGLPDHCFAAAETTGASRVHGGQYDCQKLSTTTFPRSDARLRRASAHRPASARTGRGDDLLVVDRARDLPPLGLCDDLLDEQPSSAKHDDHRGDWASAAHQTMKTVVPTRTWSKSHSESGTCIRMQPWDAM